MANRPSRIEIQTISTGPDGLYHGRYPFGNVPLSLGGSIVVATTLSGRIGHVKWNPGHWMLSDEQTRSFGGETANKRIEQAACVSAGANVIGWVGRYTWDILETSQGVYDFSQVDADLAALSGKRMGIRIESTYSPSNHIPPYILANPIYGVSPVGGQYGWWWADSSTWYVPAKWRSAVMNRWIALIQALGAYYDSNPLIDFIIDGDDTSWGLTISTGYDYSIAALRTQVDAEFAAATVALPTTNFVFNTSYIETGGYQDSANFIQDGYVKRVAFGGPDILGYSFLGNFPSGWYYGQQVYAAGNAGNGNPTTPGTDYRGKMAGIHCVESPELTGGLGTYTPADIFAYANGVLHMNYILWCYLAPGTSNGTWTGGSNSILPLINANPISYPNYPSSYP